MKAKSSAHYQREYRKRLREQGLVKKEVWILPEHANRLLVIERQLRIREGQISSEAGAKAMTKSGVENPAWTTQSLFESMAEADVFVSGRARLELIDGVEPSLHVVMTEYGDLPVFLTVSGEQIVVESLLWSAAEVSDVARFNDAVLRTHKYFPLSTIGLDQLGDEGDYYHMFGALSSASSLQNVLVEVETLASNVIQATEAYSEFLTVSQAAN